MTIITETFMYSNYVINRIIKSKIDPKATIHKEIGMSCPHCSRERPSMKHGDRIVCERCGLVMKLLGNGLTCDLVRVDDEKEKEDD